MRTGLVPLAAWGAGLIAIALLGRLAFGLTVLPTLLLAGAGAASAATGVASTVTRRRADRPAPGDGPHLNAELSLSSVATAAGGSLALVGISAGGEAFFWPGMGLAVLGAMGILRETLAARRELAALNDGGQGPR